MMVAVCRWAADEDRWVGGARGPVEIQTKQGVSAEVEIAREGERLISVNFKMNAGYGWSPMEEIVEQEIREGTVKAVACDSVSSACSCSNKSEQPAFLLAAESGLLG